MIFKTTPKKQILLILLIVFSIVTTTAQTNLPYFTNFEGNNGGWTDGGDRSKYIANYFAGAPQGRGSWVLYNDDGNDSSFYKDFNLSGYTTVTISFSFKSNGFDNDKDFFVVKLGGTTILTYKHDDDWNDNNIKYTANINLSSSNYTFTNSSEIRFECDAGKSDYIYFDEISITGTSPSPPVADFSADNTAPYTSDVVAFTDASTNTPTSWVWSFSNPGNVTYVNGSTATSQNPQVSFNTTGLYTVTLTATNAGGNDDEIKTNYINVIEPASDNPATFTVSQSAIAPYTFFDYIATANSSGDPIIIAYNTVNSFGTPTTDGSGNALINGNGTIIFEGNVADINSTINSNPLNQLEQNTIYYFKAWSLGSGGFSRGIEVNATTAGVEAPNSFTATSSNSSNNSSFTATANSLNDNLMLVFNTEDDFGVPEDGVLYQIDDEIGNAVVLLSSVTAETITNYIDDFLLFNTVYYYRIYSVSSGIWYYSQAYQADDVTTITGDIWQNDITTDTPNIYNPYTIGDQVATNISVSGISRGSGLIGNDDDNDYEARNWNTSNSLNLSDNDYFEFTLTPDTGYEINFFKFSYDASDSNGDLNKVALRSSVDGFALNIGDETDGRDGADFDLTDDAFQNITEAITFRIYGWDADDSGVDFRIRDFGFKGAISQYAIWNGTSWSNTNGPDLGMRAVIDGDYNTGIGGTQTSFRCKALTVNAGNTLTIANDTFVQVNYNTSGAGNLTVETKGAFVQSDNDGVFNITGTSKVNKSTPYKYAWYYYTYWSSPVKNMDIEVAFPNSRRKFYWDDTSSKWQSATNQTMQTGVGYTITGSAVGVQTVSFEGEFNTGTITTPTISYNPANDENWSLIGNPYPSAIDLDKFLGTNAAVLEGAAYFWSQETAPVGGQFSGTDYIPFNATGSVSTSPDREFDGYAPSAQSFFIASKASGNARFTNAMRMADIDSNSQFFKSAGVPPKGFDVVYNKLWLNLSADNGIFSQILVAYLKGATNLDDGLVFDATKFGEGSGTFLYSTIENSNHKFVIQAKDVNSINENEKIAIGLKASIATTYSISIAKLQGDFLSRNTVYLKDNLLDVMHNLSASDYTFTSQIGEFNTRFEIVFNGQALSNENFTMSSDTIKIIELNNDDILFSTSNSILMKKISIYNLMGQHVFDIKANSASKKYNFRNQSSSVYFAKIALDDGTIITKKFIKK
ncbi:MAG: PKD domain-containing protein [Algibacter sp.]|uniref:PKD domain-containing protein n=1 Tax=Algibacter sp. TaxID=1872428 RepID=UPI0026358B49|nr:PKD domain-containing protein [Algibacter sp.]MDG1728332.1 PKD domain-containing protein [Algibacter sp.]MDG2178387.1 PKD domain-containing protein [Algibacter sp.]